MIRLIIVEAQPKLGWSFYNSWQYSASGPHSVEVRCKPDEKFGELFGEVMLEQISEQFDAVLERGGEIAQGQYYVQSYTVVSELGGVVLEVRIPLFLGETEYDDEDDQWIDLPTGGSLILLMTSQGTLQVLRGLQTGCPLREEVTMQ